MSVQRCKQEASIGAAFFVLPGTPSASDVPWAASSLIALIGLASTNVTGRTSSTVPSPASTAGMRAGRPFHWPPLKL